LSGKKRNLACYIASLGKEVTILDAYIQKTASDWMSVREDEREKNNNILPIDVFAQNKEINKLAKRLSTEI
jgi:hypothetical protein